MSPLHTDHIVYTGVVVPYGFNFGYVFYMFRTVAFCGVPFISVTTKTPTVAGVRRLTKTMKFVWTGPLLGAGQLQYRVSTRCVVWANPLFAYLEM